MERKKIISGAAFQMDYAADYIMQRYQADDYQVQKLTFDEDGQSGVLVQIKNTTKGFGSFLKTAI